MLTKFVAATIVAGALSIASCKWFNSKPKTGAFAITGNWKLDSIRVGKDTSNTIFLALLMSPKDTARLRIGFRADSTYTQQGNESSGGGKYYLTENTLYISEDSSFVPYHLSVVNDSLINLYSTDSTLLVFKRQ